MNEIPQTPEQPPYDEIIQGYVNDLMMANHRAIQAEADVRVLKARIVELQKEIAASKGS